MAKQAYRYHLAAPLGPDSLAAVREIPGVFAKEEIIVAPLSAAWLVERLLAELGFVYNLQKPKPTRKYTIDDLRTIPELREWTVDFLAGFQREGILFASNGPDESAILAHPTGAGKSLEGIVWGLLHPGTLLFVTKAGARRTIQLEVERYTTVRPTVLWPPSDRRYDASLVKDLAGQRIIIVGWEALPYHMPVLLNAGATSIVFDELHLGKGHKRWEAIPGRDAAGNDTKTFARLENRVSCAARLTANAKRRLGLSATIIPDRMRDLWGELDLIHPGNWGTYWGKLVTIPDPAMPDGVYETRVNSFVKRYCDLMLNDFGGWDDRGTSNLKELKQRMQFVVHKVDSTVTHRDLPPMRRQIVYLLKADQNVPGAFTEELRRAQSRGAKSLQEVRLAEAASRKRGYVIDEVIEAVKSKQKVVIFTGRHRDCERLEEAVKKAVKGTCPVFMAHGGHGTKVRDEIRERWMGNPATGVPPLEGPAVLIGTAEAWGECVAPDTLVLGENKSISEYKKGDRVLGAAGGYTSCRGMKTKHFTGQMIELRGTGLLPVAATPNHPVLTLSGRITPGRESHFEFTTKTPTWKRIDEVRRWDPSPKKRTQAAGDFLLVPRVKGRFTNVVFDLERHVVRACDISTRRARGAPSTLTLDEELSWLMGLYAAEGSASPREASGRGWRAFFSLNANEETTVAAKAVRILAARRIKATINPQRKTHGLNVTVRSGPFARLFSSLMGKGAHAKRIPDEVLFNTDARILQAFIDGYVTGDGHKHRDDPEKITAATVSRLLALHLQLGMARLGHLASISLRSPQKNKAKIRGREVGGGEWYMVRWRTKNKRWTRHRVLEDFIATPVRTVRSIPYVGDVIDIGTMDHTFLVSNAVVHNSYSLNHTDLAMIVMLPLNSKQLWQWEGRFYRLGQILSVLIKYIIAEGTYDEAVASILLSKLPAVADVQGDSKFKEASEQFMGHDRAAEIEERLLEAVMHDPDELFKEFENPPPELT